MAVFRTILNYDHSQEAGEVNELASMTVPDQAYTIKEILDKFAHGETLQILNTAGYYDGEEGEVSFDHVDPTLSPDFELTDAEELELQLKSKAASEAGAKEAQRSGDDDKAASDEASISSVNS